MSYYLAPSLVKLRDEINALWPNRDKTSDGWIGDASHAARVSDHNPDYSAGGVVRAIDVDKDGIDIQRLWNALVKDPRVEYIIWNYRIYTRQGRFVAQVYDGSNPHDKHMHISIRHGAGYENNTASWGLSGGAPRPPAPAPGKKTVAQLAQEVIAGQWGNNPERSRRLSAAGYNAAAVQAEVNRILSGSTPARPSNTDIARQVIAGQWGNGDERRRRLTAAGYNYAAVQAEVNRLLA